MRQVIGLLVIVFLGIGVMAYAVSIPNSFSNGQTISSDAVNNNFTAIANEINRRLLPSVQLLDGDPSWNPNGSSTSFGINDANITESSVVLITLDAPSGYPIVCVVDELFDGGFWVDCASAVPNASKLNYVAINP